MMNRTVSMQIMAAMFAAVCAVCAQLIIPIQPVPITLATLAPLLAGGFLGKRYGAMSVVIYILLGLAGAPVFVMMRSGLSVLAGPTGGFLLGYIAMAFFTGFLTEKTKGSFWGIVGGITLGTIICYGMGISWFMYLSGNGLWASLGLVLFPFLPGDILKGALATFLIKKYKKKHFAAHI